ncbi:hypothetical protein DMUE_3956 [Dictyocoela muelleri]|nr:hypothetical protein DMUE_3956 [Dictyocoela muelleri]
MDEKIIDVLLDTGSDKNLLSDQVLYKHEIKTIEKNTDIKLETDTGDIREVIGKTCKNITFEDIKIINFKFDGYVVKKISYKIILRREFLEKNYVILNFRDGLINLNGYKIEMLVLQRVSQSQKSYREKNELKKDNQKFSVFNNP